MLKNTSEERVLLALDRRMYLTEIFRKSQLTWNIVWYVSKKLAKEGLVKIEKTKYKKYVSLTKKGKKLKELLIKENKVVKNG